MATIAATVVPGTTRADKNCWTATWANVTSADTCTSVALPVAGDRSVQFSGTFDSATVALHGSNDGSNYLVLTDPQANGISTTVAKIEQIEEITLHVKPVFTGGGGSQSITVTLFMVKR